MRICGSKAPESRLPGWAGWFAVCAVLLAVPAAAVEGVLEINQACAVGPEGCVPGDPPGFPVEIVVPGSYRLTSNLDLSRLDPPDPNLSAILIFANDVTLDLNGFALVGTNPCTFGFPLNCPPNSDGEAIGIFGQNARRVAVHNGSVRAFELHGIVLGPLSRVRDVWVAEMGNLGIRVGTGSIVNNCTVTRTSGRGIEALARSVLVDNHVDDTGGFGLSIFSDSVASHNRVGSSDTVMIDGLDANVIRHNSLRTGDLKGLDLGGDSLVIGNLFFFVPGIPMEMGTSTAYGENHLSSSGAITGGTAIGCNNRNNVVTCPP